ncbi:MAG: response regulator [Desulfobacterales bacterium]
MERPVKVLMVDDEAQFRETTRKILNRRGFETLIAGSGPEALQKLDENPDVVILDVKMPEMDGHQVLREIKKRNPDLPVIMLTGHGELPSAREALVEGAFDYLSKPCDIDLLASKIHEAHEGRGRLVEFHEERLVGDVMIPIGDYTRVKEQDTVRHAVRELRGSFSCRISTSRLMETGHRSVLVFDASNELTGVLSIIDLMNAVMPGYLSAAKPSTADSIRYSPLFWQGMFTHQIQQIADRKVADFMQPAPESIDADASLMEAAYVMVSTGARRLIVKRKASVVGVIREQEIFFEIEKILR